MVALAHTPWNEGARPCPDSIAEIFAILHNDCRAADLSVDAITTEKTFPGDDAPLTVPE